MEPLFADEEHIKKQRAAAKLLKKTRWWQTKLSQGVCYYCGHKFIKEDLTMDHLVPVSHGGKSIKSNVVVACFDCNQKKRSTNIVDWQLRNDEA